jgi:hypothetical protein
LEVTLEIVVDDSSISQLLEVCHCLLQIASLLLFY